MKKSTELFDIGDICDYFGISQATIRRRIQERRTGIGSFPLPLFRSGHRLLWRASDIRAWEGEEIEAVGVKRASQKDKINN
jgi:predicted DNA-binding transcriptional regulator AlpA